MDYALYFMTESQEDPSIVIRDFAHLTDGAGNPTGYYVSFNNEAGPAGYVLLSLISGENPIVEGAFEGGGLFDTEEAASLFAETQLATLDGEGSQEAQIIYRGPEQIYLPVEGDTYYSVYDGETTTLETGIMPCEDNLSGVFDWSVAKIDNSTVFKIKNFGSGSDYWLQTDFVNSVNNCGPTVATNILWYWGKQRGCSSVMNKVSASSSRKAQATTIFNKMYVSMGSNAESATDSTKIYGAFQSFFGTAAGTGVWNYKEIEGWRSFEDYQAELDGHCPILLSYFKQVDPTKTIGHAVMVFGYANSTTNMDYLFAMDGKHNYGRFVDFEYYPSMYGRKIWVA